MLGALLTAVSTALRRLPTVHLKEKPRMADFAEWGTAAEPAMGLADGEFMESYNRSRELADATALEATPIGAYLIELVEACGPWSGTATELLAELNQRANGVVRRQHGFPQSAKALGGMLQRLAPNLRAVGIAVAQDRAKNRNRTRIIELSRMTTGAQNSVQLVHDVRKVDATKPPMDTTADATDRGPTCIEGQVDAMPCKLDVADDMDATVLAISEAIAGSDDSGRSADEANHKLARWLADQDREWGEI